MKVSLCLTGMASHPGKKIVGGQMWNGRSGKRTPVEWQMGYHHYVNHILNKNDVDVFMHSPSLEVKDDLIKTYKPKDALFEPDPQFNTQGFKTDKNYPDGVTSKTQITIARWYSIYKCIQLKRKYERTHGFKYNIVMIGRFDVAWMVDVNFGDFDPNYFYASNWCVMQQPNGQGIRHENWFHEGWPDKDQSKLKHIHTGYPHTPHYPALADYWFFGGSEIIDKFGNLYENIGQFLSEGVPSNHEFALKQLKKTGLLPKLRFTFHIHNDCFLARHVYTDWRK